MVSRRDFLAGMVASPLAGLLPVSSPIRQGLTPSLRRGSVYCYLHPEFLLRPDISPQLSDRIYAVWGEDLRYWEQFEASPILWELCKLLEAYVDGERVPYALAADESGWVLRGVTDNAELYRTVRSVGNIDAYAKDTGRELYWYPQKCPMIYEILRGKVEIRIMARV